MNAKFHSARSGFPVFQTTTLLKELLGRLWEAPDLHTILWPLNALVGVLLSEAFVSFAPKGCLTVVKYHGTWTRT